MSVLQDLHMVSSVRPIMLMCLGSLQCPVSRQTIDLTISACGNRIYTTLGVDPLLNIIFQCEIFPNFQENVLCVKVFSQPLSHL